MGETWCLADFKSIYASIEQWFSQESSTIKYQSLADEHQDEENVRMYHHELHRKKIRKPSILRLLAFLKVTGIVQSTLRTQLKTCSYTKLTSTKLLRILSLLRCHQYSLKLTIKSCSNCQSKWRFMTPWLLLTSMLHQGQMA